MKMEVYTIEEIIDVIRILEAVQDSLEVEDSYEIWNMIQEAIEVLDYKEDNE